MLPFATTPPTCGLGPSDSGQACVSATARHAGCPPIMTVAHPGPGLSGVPWLVLSPTRAAGCPISRSPSINVHERAANCEGRTGLQLKRARRLDRDCRGLDVELPFRFDRHGPAVAVDFDCVSLFVLDCEPVVVESYFAALLVAE